MKKILLLIFVCSIASYVFASDELSQEAIEYRNRGYTAQQNGDIETALVFYQKAVSMDPYYAVAYNDLGIIYEIKGMIDKAESAYVKALTIDPNFAETHSNLALLYEAKKMFDKAIIHWIRRVELGDREDNWTKKAWEKLWTYAPDKAKETEARILAMEVTRQLEREKEENIIKAKKLYQQAMVFYNRKDYLNALPLFLEAKRLVPGDTDIEGMYKEAEAKSREINIILHSEQAITYYRQGEYQSAKQEFEKILELIPE